jgi:hypothetical protein
MSLDHYTTMVKTSIPEKDQLFVSLLSPLVVKLDLPVVMSTAQIENNEQENQQRGFIGDFSLRNIVRVAAVSAAIGLTGYIVYIRIKRSKSQKK